MAHQSERSSLLSTRSMDSPGELHYGFPGCSISLRNMHDRSTWILLSYHGAFAINKRFCQWGAALGKTAQRDFPPIRRTRGRCRSHPSILPWLSSSSITVVTAFITAAPPTTPPVSPKTHSSLNLEQRSMAPAETVLTPTPHSLTRRPWLSAGPAGTGATGGTLPSSSAGRAGSGQSVGFSLAYACSDDVCRCADACAAESTRR